MLRVVYGLGAAVLIVTGCSKPDPAQEAAAPRAPAEPLALALQWPAGRQLKNQLEWVQTLETFYPQVPEPLRTEMVVTQQYSLTVKRELAEGRREILLEFGHIQMVTRLKDRPWFQFDSTKPGDSPNPVAGALSRVRGQTFTLELSAAGELENAPGLPDFLASVRKEAPAQARPMFDGIFGEKSLRHLIELSHGLPKSPVSRGDSWPVEVPFSLGALGEISLAATNIFDKWEEYQGRLCARVSSVGDFTGAAGPLPGTTTIEDGASAGHILMDPSEGTIVESEVKQTCCN